MLNDADHLRQLNNGVRSGTGLRPSKPNLRDRRDEQRVHADLRVVALELAEARVDDVPMAALAAMGRRSAVVHPSAIAV